MFGSGNLAPVYFHFSDKRVTRNELERTYPGLFSALVEHEGVGVVLAYEDDGTAVAWGKSGSRWLHTGGVEGVDPLLPYGDPEVRSGQLRRLAEFPNNGDLTVFSTVYPDGTVAAMEELIGSHGGMGGAQTDAFILHPNDLAVPATTNSADVFNILNARRGTPAVRQLLQPAEVAGDDWAPANLGAGIRKVGSWLGLAGRALRLDSSAYREAVRDPLMTGPALLIGLAAPFLAGLAQPGGFDLETTLSEFLRWLVLIVVVYGAGRVLTNRQRRVERLRRGILYSGVPWIGFCTGYAGIRVAGGHPRAGPVRPLPEHDDVLRRGVDRGRRRARPARLARHRVPDRGPPGRCVLDCGDAIVAEGCDSKHRKHRATARAHPLGLMGRPFPGESGLPPNLQRLEAPLERARLALGDRVAYRRSLLAVRTDVN